MNSMQIPTVEIKTNLTENNNGFFYEMQKHLLELIFNTQQDTQKEVW